MNQTVRKALGRISYSGKLGWTSRERERKDGRDEFQARRKVVDKENPADNHRLKARVTIYISRCPRHPPLHAYCLSEIHYS